MPSAAALAAATVPVAPGAVVALEGAALVAAERRARAALSSIADGTPRIERTHASTVWLADEPVAVLPVRYAPSERGALRNVDRGALVLVSPDRVRVVPTVGAGHLESLGATGLDAIAFTDLDGDGELEIVMIHSTVAPPDRYLSTPVVVRRAHGAFAVDEALSRALEERGGGASIAALHHTAQPSAPVRSNR